MLSNSSLGHAVVWEYFERVKLVPVRDLWTENSTETVLSHLHLLLTRSPEREQPAHKLSVREETAFPGNVLSTCPIGQPVHKAFVGGRSEAKRRSVMFAMLWE